jgi:uncharacterized membrane protein YtjA (UPF0391 family)
LPGFAGLRIAGRLDPSRRRFAVPQDEAGREFLFFLEASLNSPHPEERSVKDRVSKDRGGPNFPSARVTVKQGAVPLRDGSPRNNRTAHPFYPGAAFAPEEWRSTMLSWALTFLVVALIAAVLGFGGIAGTAIEIAKIIFFVAIVLFLISAVVGLIQRRSAHLP